MNAIRSEIVELQCLMEGLYGDKPEYDRKILHLLLGVTDLKYDHDIFMKANQMVFILLKSLEDNYGPAPCNLFEHARHDLQRWAESLRTIRNCNLL